MPTKPTKPSVKSYVTRALDGMTTRLEKGESLQEFEVPLFITLLQAYNSRDLLNYEDVLKEWMEKTDKLAADINSQKSLRSMTQTERWKPPQNAGPPNQGPGPAPDQYAKYFGKPQ